MTSSQPITPSEPASVPSETFPTRVFFVAPFGLGQKTTVWARTLPLAQALTRRGMDASILIPPWDTPAQAGLSWEDGGVHVENVQIRRGPPLILARLARRIRRNQPHIIHIVKPVAYAGAIQMLFWYLRKWAAPQTKIILDADDWEQDWAVLNRRPRWIQALVGWQENWGLRHADGVTTASRWLENSVKNLAPAMPTCYLPNGLEVSHAPGPQSDADTITPDTVLYFSRFIEVPPKWLADFCRELFSAHPSSRLTIAGAALAPDLEARFKQEFQEFATAQNLNTERIDWLGHVRLEAVPHLYASAACAIFPARPTPLQEAKCSVRLATTLLHGVPVVASAVGEQTAYGRLGDAQLVPPDATPEQFAKYVVDVLRSPQTLLRRQQSARAQLLSEYNWDILGQHLHDFYRTVWNL